MENYLNRIDTWKMPSKESQLKQAETLMMMLDNELLKSKNPKNSRIIQERRVIARKLIKTLKKEI